MFFFAATWQLTTQTLDSTNRNLSSFAKNAEGVNPPHSIYRICNLCSTLSTKCGAFSAKKIFRLPHLRKVEDFGKKKQKKKIGSGGTRTRALSFTVRCSTHYSIPRSLDIEAKIAYMKKKSNLFFELEKKS